MQRFANLSLRWKLLISHGLMLLLLIGVSVIAFTTMQANMQAQQAVGDTLTVIGLADEARAAVSDMETGYRGFLLSGSDDFLEPYIAGGRLFHDDLAELVAATDDPVQRARWVELGRQVDRWQTDLVEPRIAVRRQLPLGAAPDGTLISPANLTAVKTQFDQVRTLFSQAIEADEQLLAERNRAAVEANQKLVGTLVTFTVAATLVGVMAALWLSRDVADAAGRLATVAGRIAAGNLSERVRLRRRDELGQSAAAFDRMAAWLEATIHRLETSESELRRQQTELERSNRELQDFASVASHDLQEPLRKVQAFGERLSTRYGSVLPPDGRDYLDRMQAAASRMQTLINDLLAFSRVTTRAQPFVRIELQQIVEQVVGDLEVRLEQEGGTVEVGALPRIEADPSQMRQLFQNLIANGLKFHQPDVAPRVRVWSELDGDDSHVRILIADNGIGFDEKYLDRIFTIFQRLHTRGEYEGTGIGLAVCRKIVERHGGEITALSAPDAGATFVVRLPLVQTTPTVEAAVPPAESELQEVA